MEVSNNALKKRLMTSASGCAKIVLKIDYQNFFDGTNRIYVKFKLDVPVFSDSPAPTPGPVGWLP